MKNSYVAHPARQPEFLSRLHDGELSAAERARFESHRAHCVECRNAAAEFEAALHLFRSSKTSPAAPDLAARVLRKLQASNRRRVPFGIFHGIDVRWAGAFAAALIAMIIGSSIAIRQERRPAEPEGDFVRGYMVETPGTATKKEPAAPAPPAADPRKEARQKENKTEGLFAPASPAEEATASLKKQEEVVDRLSQTEDDEKQRNALEVPAASERETKTRDKAASQPSRRVAGELPGGEGSAPSVRSILDEASVPAFLPHIVRWDSPGSPPEWLEEPPPVGPEYRGRSYVLIVDIRGTVIGVDVEKERHREDAMKAGQPAIPESLWKGRFKPGDRPRRVVVEIR